MLSRNPGQSAEQRPFFELVAKYSASRFYRQAIGIVTAYLRPKLLTPEEFGLYNLLRVVPDYVAYSHMGTNTALRYQVPQALAAQQAERVSQLQNTAWATTTAINGLVTLIMILMGLLGNSSPEARWGLGIMGFGFLIAGVFEYQMSLLKAHEQFPSLTKTNYVSMTVTTLLTLIFLLAWGLYGLFVSFALSQLFSTWYVSRQFTVRPQFTWDKATFVEMVQFGFPIMALGVVIALIQSEDRLLIAYLLGNEQLGFYGISGMVMSFLLNVPGAAREILEPQMMRDLDHSNSSELTERYFLKPLLETAAWMPLLLGPVVLCLPVAVSLLLPRYQPGVAATQILALGGFFIAQVLVLRGMIAARKRQWAAARLLLIPLVLNVPGCFLAVHLGFGINGIAFSSALAYLLVYLLLVGLMVHDLHLKGQAVWRRTRWQLLLPFLVMLVLLGILAQWKEPLGWSGLPYCLAKVLIFEAVLGGLFLLSRPKERQ